MRPAIVSGIVTGDVPISYWLDYEQSLFFLVRRAKRRRHANDHARDSSGEMGEAFFFSGCNARARVHCPF